MSASTEEATLRSERDPAQREGRTARLRASSRPLAAEEAAVRSVATRLPDVPEVGCGRKGLHFCNGEDTEEALATAEVVVPNGRVVLLPGCVQDVNLHFLPVQHHLLPVAVGLGWLVVFHKLGMTESTSISKSPLLFKVPYFEIQIHRKVPK